MCHRDDEDPLRLDAVEQAVGKPWDEYAAEPTTKEATALRELE